MATGNPAVCTAANVISTATAPLQIAGALTVPGYISIDDPTTAQQ